MTAAESSPAATTFRPACGWCDSTHIADVSCSCTTPCKQGWCPAVDMELERDASVPLPRDAVA